MAKQTLLELTQTILSRMSSDEINSISDTIESLQVANIIKVKYYDIMSRDAFPKHNQLFQLNPSNDTTRPTLMYIPDGITHIETIKYFNTDEDSNQGYTYVTQLPTEQFLDMVNGFNPTESNVDSFLFNDTSNGYPSSFTFYYKNDQQPQWCTVLSNYYVIFDGFDATQDSTLQASKIMCFGQVIPPFLLEDAFIPNINEDQFPLLLNEATALAFYELKQMPNAKAEQEIKRQWSSTQKTRSMIDKPSYFEQLNDYGRRSNSGGYGRFRQR